MNITMYLFLGIMLVQAAVILGLFGKLILNKSPQELFKQKKPFHHYIVMLAEIYKIAPQRTRERMAWIIFVSILVFSSLFHSVISGDALLVFSQNIAYGIIMFANLVLLVLSLCAIMFTDKKEKNREYSWFILREKAFLAVYGKFETSRFNEGVV